MIWRPENINTGSVVCIKGMEPFARDFDSFLYDLSRKRPIWSGWRHLDHFVIGEDKLPGCLTLHEAIEEAEAAITVHRDFAAKGKAPPHLPAPVALFRLPEHVEKAALDCLLPLLTSSVRRKAELLSRDGLAALAYVYPTIPIRAHAMAGNIKLAQRLVPRWVGLAGDLLVSGFIPTTVQASGRGSCCDYNNAVIDGGFVDTGSVVAEASLVDDRDFTDAMIATICSLTATAVYVACGNGSANENHQFMKQYFYAAIFNELREKLLVQGGPQRMQDFFHQGSNIESAIIRFNQQILE